MLSLWSAKERAALHAMGMSSLPRVHLLLPECNFLHYRTLYPRLLLVKPSLARSRHKLPPRKLQRQDTSPTVTKQQIMSVQKIKAHAIAEILLEMMSFLG